MIDARLLTRVLSEPAYALTLDARGWTALLGIANAERLTASLAFRLDGLKIPEKVRAFMAKLRETVPVPMRTWDERLTTVQAQRMLRDAGHKAKDQKGKMDQTAAAIILQSFLDSQS